jgi:hypothetical protein
MQFAVNLCNAVLQLRKTGVQCFSNILVLGHTNGPYCILVDADRTAF